MTLRAGLCCWAVAVAATGCAQWTDGAPLRALTEPPYQPPGVVDVDAVLLSQAQMQSITGGGTDLTIIPSMDGKVPVDIEGLATSVPAACRFVFAENAVFGPDVEDFHKTSFQDPPRAALISQGAAAYGDVVSARQAFDALSDTVGRCADGPDGALLVGEVTGDAQALSIRPGSCGRDYRLKAAVLVEVTFCAFPESVPQIVMANILSRIPGG